MYLENLPQNVTKMGTFENVCMNGYRDILNYNSRLYRIVDYMQYQSPCYTITNELVDNNDILVIGCSMSMRTNAYLSLLCHSVTVLDPRFFNDKDYLTEIIQNNFDAVILYPSYNLIEGIGGYNAAIQSVDVKEQDNGLYKIIVKVLNNGSMTWYYDKQIRINLWVDNIDFGLRAGLLSDLPVEPGQTYTFVLESEYINNDVMDKELSVQMLREGKFYFGEKFEVQ